MSEFRGSFPKPPPTPKKERKRPKAKNAAHRADDFARTYGSEDRVLWIQSLPCVVGGCRKVSENVHTTTDGMSRKADASTIVPMCAPHHRELHREGRETFEGTHMLDLAALALDCERCWRRYAGHTGEPK